MGEQKEEKEKEVAIARVVKAYDAFHEQIMTLQSEHRDLMGEIRSRIDKKKIAELHNTLK